MTQAMPMACEKEALDSPPLTPQQAARPPAPSVQPLLPAVVDDGVNDGNKVALPFAQEPQPQSAELRSREEQQWATLLPITTPLISGSAVAEVPGLRLFMDALGEDSEAAALADIAGNRHPPVAASNVHPARQWGWHFSSVGRSPPLGVNDMAPPIPDWQHVIIASMLARDPDRRVLPRLEDWPDGVVDHALLNTYEPGDGVIAHCDDASFWTGWVIGLSLSADITMLFRPEDPAAVPLAVRLPRRSAFILTGPARWSFRHEIARSLHDHVPGEGCVPRRYRASITWRAIAERWLPAELRAQAEQKRQVREG